MAAENSNGLSNLDMELQQKLYTLLHQLYEGGYRYFYSGLYEGFDLIAAEMVVMLKMRGGHDEAKLICCVTTEGQAQDYAPENRAQFLDLLSEADELTIIGQQFSSSKLVVEDEFINACDLILCWDDGEDSDFSFSLGKATETGAQIMNLFEIQKIDMSAE